jgi:Bacterial regulatory helix-turn-helix protein, lysR family
MVRPRLPPLNAIKAFEAAARLGSFSRAAEELNVTHGAVSRQIRLLEDWLGVRLFVRTSRNAVPTLAGADLLAEASPALDRLADGPLRAQHGAQERGSLCVSALPTFAMRWIIPRLPEFQFSAARGTREPSAAWYSTPTTPRDHQSSIGRSSIPRRANGLSACRSGTSRCRPKATQACGC